MLRRAHSPARPNASRMDLHWRWRWRWPISLKKFVLLCNKFHLISSDSICSRCEIEWSVIQLQQHWAFNVQREAAIGFVPRCNAAAMHTHTHTMCSTHVNCLICNNNFCAARALEPDARAVMHGVVMSCCVKCFSQRQWEQITWAVSSYRLRAQHFISFFSSLLLLSSAFCHLAACRWLLSLLFPTAVCPFRCARMCLLIAQVVIARSCLCLRCACMHIRWRVDCRVLPGFSDSAIIGTVHAPWTPSYVHHSRLL